MASQVECVERDGSRLVVSIPARMAEAISDAAVSHNRHVLDVESNGGRVVVVGRTVIYTCTDAYRIGSVNRFASPVEAQRWAESAIEELSQEG